MELFSNILVPLIILYIVIYGKSKNIDIYDSFVKGAVDGLKSAWSITPYIIGIFFYPLFYSIEYTENWFCKWKRPTITCRPCILSTNY